MKNQFFQMKNLLKVMAGILVILGIYVTQATVAYGSEAFTNASLQGKYAYINNSGDVASLGPIYFNGRGRLTLDIIANLPCANVSQNCARTINDLPPVTNGTYSVEEDGTGVANVPFSTGTVVYDFMISKTERRGRTTLATEVFAAAQSGGLAGQLIVPTWSRIAD